jgi:CheY-like chemotaxis protein
MPSRRILNKNSFLELLKSSLPNSLDAARPSGKECLIFEVSSQHFELAASTSNEQLYLTLTEISRGNLPHQSPSAQFGSFPEMLGWIQGFSSKNFSAVTSLQDHAKKVTTLRITPSPGGGPATVESRLPEEIYANGEKVLVLEDEDNVRAIVSAMLRRIGYSVVACRSSAEAEKLLETENCSLALIDIMVPRLGGKVLAEQFKKAKPDLKIVLMTGLGQDEVMSGTFPVLFKPFDLLALGKEMKKALGSAARPKLQADSVACTNTRASTQLHLPNLGPGHSLDLGKSE